MDWRTPAMIVVAVAVIAVAYYMLRPLPYPASVRACEGVEDDLGECIDAVAVIKHNPSLCEMQALDSAIPGCRYHVNLSGSAILSSGMRHDKDFECDFNKSGCPITNTMECTKAAFKFPYKDYQKALQPGVYTERFSYVEYTPLQTLECKERFTNHSAAEACIDPIGQVECYMAYATAHGNLAECDLILRIDRYNTSYVYYRQEFDRCRLAIAAMHNDPNMCLDSEICWWYFAELRLDPGLCDNMKTPFNITDPKRQICKAAVLAQMGQ